MSLSVEFHQIYNFHAVGDNDEMITFCRPQLCLNKHFWRHFLAYLRSAGAYFNETINVTHLLPRPHDADDIFKVMVQRSRSQTTFPENALLWWRHTDCQFAVKDRLVYSMLSCYCVYLV